MSGRGRGRGGGRGSRRGPLRRPGSRRRRPAQPPPTLSKPEHEFVQTLLFEAVRKNKIDEQIKLMNALKQAANYTELWDEIDVLTSSMVTDIELQHNPRRTDTNKIEMYTLKTKNVTMKVFANYKPPQEPRQGGDNSYYMEFKLIKNDETDDAKKYHTFYLSFHVREGGEGGKPIKPDTFHTQYNRDKPFNPEERQRRKSSKVKVRIDETHPTTIGRFLSQWLVNVRTAARPVQTAPSTPRRSAGNQGTPAPAQPTGESSNTWSRLRRAFVDSPVGRAARRAWGRGRDDRERTARSTPRTGGSLHLRF